MRPRRLVWVSLAGIYAGINLFLVWRTIRLSPDASGDWELFTALAAGADPYVADMAVPFVWSPLMAPVMALATQLGYWTWVIFHLAVLLLLRDVRLIGLVLMSWAYWFDVAQGNTLTFAFVAGVLALRGSFAASLSSFALLLLMPRPLVLPLVAWLVWKRRSLRWPFVVLFVVHAVAVLGSGYAMDWIESLGSYVLVAPGLGPSALIGHWWLLAGIPLGLWLWSRGWLGLAGIAISPYLLPQYLLWPLLDTGRPRSVNGLAPRRRAGACVGPGSPNRSLGMHPDG